MKELAKRFIDKECLISSFDSNHQFEGVIKEVSDSAILVEKNGTVEAINLDFVIRIREYPKNKKGKKKSVVLDWYNRRKHYGMLYYNCNSGCYFVRPRLYEYEG